MRTIMYKDISVDYDKSELAEIQKLRQEQNKNALAQFLETASVSFNGKEYGVTEADQNEMQAMVMQYKMLSQAGVETELQWHAKHEECEVFSLEQMVALAAAVKSFVLPHMNKMQAIKAQIYQATTKEEVLEIEIFKEN